MDKYPLSLEKQKEMLKQFGFIQGTVRVNYHDLIKYNQEQLKLHLSNFLIDNSNLEITMHKPSYSEEANVKGQINIYVRGNLNKKDLDYEFEKNNYLDFLNNYYKEIVLEKCLSCFSKYQFDKIFFTYDKKDSTFKLSLKNKETNIDQIYQQQEYKDFISYISKRIDEVDFCYAFPTRMEIISS
jgi:hypothetical protein